jgi:hypothetical protein
MMEAEMFNRRGLLKLLGCGAVVKPQKPALPFSVSPEKLEFIEVSQISGLIGAPYVGRIEARHIADGTILQK